MPSRRTASANAKENKKETDVATNNKKTEQQNGSESDGDEDDGDGWFEVDKILGETRGEDGQLYYKVRWMGYPPEYDTFEPASELEHCVEIVATWETEKATRRKAKASKKGMVGLNISIYTV